MNPIDPGKFRHRVTLMRDMGTGSERSNDPIPDWQSIGEYWACVEPLGGREAFYASQVTPLATHKITMWQVCEIYPSDRFVFEGSTIEIVNINNVMNQNQFFEIMASSKVAQG